MKHLIAIAVLIGCVGPAGAAILAPISPHLALANRGQCVTVRGIASVRHDPQRLGTDVDIDGKNSPFLGYILPGNESDFPMLKKVNGQRVDITGVVQFYLGRAEVVMTSPSQLKLASSDAKGPGLTHIPPEFQKSGDQPSYCD